MVASFEIVPYGGWSRCARVTNGAIEAIATLEVGPRIIRFGPVGGVNLFKEFAGDMGRIGGDKWRIYGGHRLWLAPEDRVKTYTPDNEAVEHTWDGETLTLSAPAAVGTGIARTIRLSLHPTDSQATVDHELRNDGATEFRGAAWALSVMAPGCRAVLPQEPFVAHGESLLPSRPVVLWPYTNMADPRWTWGESHIILQQDPALRISQKIGVRNSLGWGAVLHDGFIFLKRTEFDPAAEYPDFGSNYEVYANGDMLELETLGPLTTLGPHGQMCRHRETWEIRDGEIDELPNPRKDHSP